MKMSELGLALVKHFEGLFLKAYLDPVGIWTIGYGNIGPEAREGNTITEARAEELLREDLEDAESSVSRLIEVDLQQHEFDALVAFAFNVGGGSLSRSTLRRKLNEGDRAGAALEFLRWNKARVGGVLKPLAGLTRRRRAEAHLFEFGTLNFFDGHGVVDPDEDDVQAEAVATTAAAASTGSDLDDFTALVKSWELKHFRPSELLELGAANGNPDSAAFGKNTFPPRSLWPNMRQTIQTLDKLRMVLDAPIFISSVYRSPAYNLAIGGASNSQHTHFCAIDFSARTLSGPSHWAAQLRGLRSSGLFSGGIGVYNTFVHLDSRGTNVDF